MNNQRTVADIILAIDGCSDAWQWANTLPEGTTVEQAWNTCPNVDWMFWLVALCEGYQGGKMHLAMVSCIRLLLPVLSDGPNKATCVRYLDSVERENSQPSYRNNDVMCQDAMALWDVVVMSDGDTREGSVYAAVDLADTVSYESLLALAECVLGLHYSKLLALMADRFRMALPWSLMASNINALIASVDCGSDEASWLR